MEIKDKQKKALRGTALALGILFLALGLLRGEGAEVLEKAVRIADAKK